VRAVQTLGFVVLVAAGMAAVAMLGVVVVVPHLVAWVLWGKE
jgi:hypothetical protein